MQNIIKQAYQAEVLLKKVQIVTVGNRYPFKDQVVITTENTYQAEDYDLFSFTHRIDVVVKCENRFEAFKVSSAIQKYLDKDLMLPLHVGVFQKPFLRDNQKARKHFAYTIDDSKTLIKFLPELEKNKSLKFSSSLSSIPASSLSVGFDLTYQIQDFKMEHLFMEDDFDGRPLDNPFYRLSLYTTSIFENIDDKTKESTKQEEIVIFHIKGDSESEIISLAKILNSKLKQNEIISLKGAFPRLERDFYSVNISNSCSELLSLFIKK